MSDDPKQVKYRVLQVSDSRELSTPEDTADSAPDAIVNSCFPMAKGTFLIFREGSQVPQVVTLAETTHVEVTVTSPKDLFT